MKRTLTVASFAGFLVALASPVLAQVAISTKAGMVHVADGDVLLAGKPLEMQPSSFPEVKEGQVLQTGEGRAEVLLAPGTFLRMGEDTAFKMLNNRISDTRLLLEKGTVLIEAMDLLDGNYMTIAVGDVVVNPQKEGLIEISANPVRIRVYSGEARVSGGGQALLVKSGREVLPKGEQWASAKFDENDTNALYRWSRRRAEYHAKANISAARSAGTGMTFGDSRGRWIFNPWFGMMTFLPYSGTFRSPFGFNYYTPYTVIGFFTPRPVYSGGGFGGGGGGFERSIGGSYSGGWAGGGAPVRSTGGAYGGAGGGSMGGSPAPSAGASSGGSSAPVRGGESSGGRGGAGGGGRQ